MPDSRPDLPPQLRDLETGLTGEGPFRRDFVGWLFGLLAERTRMELAK